MPSLADVPAYLRRIDVPASVCADASSLRSLHLAHLYTVPFENLDVRLKRPIVLDVDRLYAKIVTRRRGGFCYELNGLFAWLLGSLGYEVTHLSARVAREDGGYSEEFDHLVLQVRIPAEPSSTWLVDVGFGDSFLEPLEMNATGEQVQGESAYRLARGGGELTLWRRTADGSAARQYRFTLQPREFVDFAQRCVFHQTSPESTFTQKQICTLATPGGRVTLGDSRLITTVNGQREERQVAGDTEYVSLLHAYFGVSLNGAF